MLEEALKRSTQRGMAAGLAIGVVAIVAVSSTPASSGTSLPAKVMYIKLLSGIPSDGDPHKALGAVCPDGWSVVSGGNTGAWLPLVDTYPTSANGADPGRQGWTVDVEGVFMPPVNWAQYTIGICVKGASVSGTWP